MNTNRAAEIAFLLQERRVHQLWSREYMIELQTAAEDLGIPDGEMLDFCIFILCRCIEKSPLYKAIPSKEGKPPE